MTVQQQIIKAGKSYADYIEVKKKFYPKEKRMTAQQYKKLWQ